MATQMIIRSITERDGRAYSQMRFAQRIQRLPYLRNGEWRFLATGLAKALKRLDGERHLPPSQYEDLQDIIAGWQAANAIPFLVLPSGTHKTGPAREFLAGILRAAEPVGPMGPVDPPKVVPIRSRSAGA